MTLKDIKIKDIVHVDGWRHVANPEVEHITVQMYITRRCNHTCPYCTHMDNTEKFKTFEEYIELMDLIYDAVGEKDLIDFSFFGGEPTIVPRFNEIIDYILSKWDNTYVTLTTNASMSIEWWKTLEKWKGRIHCFISYQHNSNKQRPLEVYIEKMKYLDSIGFTYYISVMLENECEDEIKEVIKRFVTIPEISKYLTYASIDFTGVTEKYAGIEELFHHIDYQVFEEQDFALELTLKNGEIIHVNDHMPFKIYQLNKFKYFKCQVGHEHILLDSNGDIYVCLSHILSDQAPIGNVYTKNVLNELAFGDGRICTFDECVSELWIEKERILNI